MKFLLSIAVALLLCSASISKVNAQTADTTITVKVKGITCGTDLKMIQTNVGKLDGVKECKPGKKGATTSFYVTFNPAMITKEDLFTAIEGTGSCENPTEKPYKVKP